MSVKKYLSPIDPDELGYRPSEFAAMLGTKVKAYLPGANLPAMPKGGLLLLGVEEDRGAENNAGCAAAPNEIRRALYNLVLPCENMKMVDYGNIIVGQTLDDTYCAVAEVLAAAFAKGTTVILLGGSQDLTFAAYKSYELCNHVINITTIDPRFDLEQCDEITSRTWLRNIVMQSPNYLFYLNNIGYQTYYVGQEYIKLMDDLKFDSCRLGLVQQDMSRAEALIRNADLVSVDIAAIRQSDAPANGNPSPHGFYGEEYCQMMRFAGMNDQVSCLGLFELNPLYDNRSQTANMVAQGLWYFIEGFYLRKHDHPLRNPGNSQHFIVNLEKENLVIEFYKGKLTDRWWIQVPCHNTKNQDIYSSKQILPCTYSDYQQAMQGEVPSIWWHYFNRMNA